jgi:glycosyltransferase involved in cell wall biosynthesis
MTEVEAVSGRTVRVAVNACSIGDHMTGIGHHAANLLRGLARANGRQHYVALRTTPEPHGEWREAPHVTELMVNQPGPMWEQVELPTLLADLGVEVYHNPAFGLPVVKTTRLVCTVHDCIPRLFPEYAPGWLRDFFHHWAPVWMNLADHIICVSEHTKRDVVHLYGADPAKVTVVYQAANPALQPVADETRIVTVQRRYGIDAPYILSMGRVELRKNVGGLLEAFRAVRERMRSPILLVLAGPRDENPYDPEGILPPEGRRGEVVVTGYVPEADLAALYSGCRVFCFPSFYEGFGMPVLEAMQCGAPVVTSRVSSMPEVGGDACRYVNPYEPQEIARGLLSVLDDEEARAEMRERGLARASRFSLERFGAETADVYRRVADRPGPDLSRSASQG